MRSSVSARRDFLSAALLSARASPRQTSQRALHPRRCRSAIPAALPAPPFGRLLGDGLDARLFTDLSTLGLAPALDARLDHRRTPHAHATVLRAHRDALEPAADRRVDAARRRPRRGADSTCRLRDLDAHVAPSAARASSSARGNADQTNYGLMSTADWEGIPLDGGPRSRRPAAGGRTRVLVSGVDDDTQASRTSIAGRQLDLHARRAAARDPRRPHERRAADARSRLPRPAHRAGLVRLQLHQVGESHRARRRRGAGDDADAGVRGADASADRSEIARASAALARDFIPAVDRHGRDAGPRREVDRRRPRRLPHHRHHLGRHRSRPTRCRSASRSNEPWVPVDDCPLPASHADLEPVVAHVAAGTRPGRYQIVLRVDDPSIRTRRLDLFFYVREIEIDEV